MIVGAHLAVSLSSPSCYAVCGTVHESQPQGGAMETNHHMQVEYDKSTND